MDVRALVKMEVVRSLFIEIIINRNVIISIISKNYSKRMKKLPRILNLDDIEVQSRVRVRYIHVRDYAATSNCRKQRERGWF